MKSFIQKNINYFNVVLFIRFLFGLYYNFDCFKSHRFLAKLYVFVYIIPALSGLLYAICIIPLTKSQLVMIVVLLLEIVFYFIISVYSNENNFKIYCSNVKVVDKLMRWKLSGEDARITFFVIASAILIQVIGYISLFSNKGYNFINLSFMCIYITLYTSNIPNMIIFEMLYIRMRYLRKYLSIITITDVIGSSQTDKELVINRYLVIYKHLLKMLDKTNIILKPMLFVGLMTAFVTAILMLYNCILEIIITGDFSNTYNITIVNLRLILFFGPMFLAELVNSEYDEMKGLLGDALCDCTDERFHEAIWKAIDYIESRPPYFTIFRLFPLDIRVVLGFYQIVVNYIIVLLQFEY